MPESVYVRCQCTSPDRYSAADHEFLLFMELNFDPRSGSFPGFVPGIGALTDARVETIDTAPSYRQARSTDRRAEGKAGSLTEKASENSPQLF
jgi:hypothetical protein